MAIELDMIEIELANDSFTDNVIRETLLRMGTKHSTENILYPTAHLLVKNDKKYICHFKEFLAIENDSFVLEPNDTRRLETIAHILSEWGVIKSIEGSKRHKVSIFIIPKKKMSNFKIKPKVGL